MMRVYVAAASCDIERALMWMARLREAGIDVTSTWPAVVLGAGTGNPRGATRSQRAGWARTDLDQVRAANVLWMLCPPRGIDAPARGAYWEASAANECGKIVMSSGDTLQSIFTALGDEFETDEAAFDHLVMVAARFREIDMAFNPMGSQR